MSLAKHSQFANDRGLCVSDPPKRIAGIHTIAQTKVRRGKEPAERANGNSIGQQSLGHFDGFLISAGSQVHGRDASAVSTK
jgi:hypothetical protein